MLHIRGHAPTITVDFPSASFDGTGSNYLSVAALACTKTFPFWVSAWVRPDKRYAAATDYVIWQTSTGSAWHACRIFSRLANAYTLASATSGIALSKSCILPYPYWTQILCKFLSSSDRRIEVNGVEEGTDATPLTPGLGAATTYIGLGFLGEIADVVFGAGTLSDPDRALLATPGGNYATVGGVTNWYPLQGNGTDTIGGANMSATGTVVYRAPRPSIRTTPYVTDLCQHVFKQPVLRTERPTISTFATDGRPNLASGEYLDVAYTGSAGAWTTRLFHYIPTSPIGHVLILDGGHQGFSEWPSYRLTNVLAACLAAGINVVIPQMPGFSPEDPVYPTNDHDADWADFSDTLNPLEHYLAHVTIAMNNLAPRFPVRSIAGLSGGGWLAAHYAAYDPRLNHASVPTRGAIAGIRNRTESLTHFENAPATNGWAEEEFYRMAAAPNRRLWVTQGPTDPDLGAQFGDTGAYLDITDYDALIFAPIRAAFPGADVQVFEDQGSPGVHEFSDWWIDNVLLPALTTPLLS